MEHKLLKGRECYDVNARPWQFMSTKNVSVPGGQPVSRPALGQMMAWN